MAPQHNPFIEHPAESTSLNGGEQWVFSFANGYGASVVRSHMSYGSAYGLWEVAVLDADGDLDYSTEITDDVLGSLSERQVADVLRDIAELPGFYVTTADDDVASLELEA